MKQIFIIAFLLLGQVTFAQCPETYWVESQNDVDKFSERYPGCTEIIGDLEITGEVNNLGGLSQLEKVGGHLHITNADNLTSLNGLQNIQSTDNFWIRESNNINDISALSGLISVGGLVIEDTKVEALPNIGQLSFVGAVSVNNNPLLEELNFSSSSNIGSVSISENESLKIISGFSGMTNGRSIYIQGNVNLESISGFSVLDNIEGGGLNIINNPNLTSIPSFNTLTYLDNLSIQENLKLSNIEGFNSLIETQWISIPKNGVQGISGFQSLKKIEIYLNIVDAPALDDIVGFNSLEDCSTVEIKNTGVRSIFGFNSLASVNTLSITNNENLLILDAFESLENVSLLEIRNNPQMGDCSTFCPYLERIDNPFWGSIFNNASGCNSMQEVEFSCIDTLAEIIAYDVELNLVNGTDKTRPLEHLNMDVYDESNTKLVSLQSDANGHVELDLTLLEPGRSYRLEAFLDDPEKLKVIYDAISFQELAEDFFTILFPNQMMDSIIAYQKKLDNYTLTANYLGGGSTLMYPSSAYNMFYTELITLTYAEISGEHDEKIEEMKRLGLGLYMMTLYLDDAANFSGLTSKAIYDTTSNLYKFFKELNSLKKILDDFKKEFGDKVLEEAMNQSIKEQMKLVFHVINKTIIKPYLASLENDKKTNEYVKKLRLYIGAIESAMFDQNALLSNVFGEIVYNAGAQYLFEDYYIPSTSSNIEQIELFYNNLNTTFPEIVSFSNEIRKVSEENNNQFLEIADFNSGYSEDLNALAGYVQNLSFVISIFSGGTAIPVAISMHEVAQAIKAGTLSLNGINTLAYGYRLVKLSDELDVITNKFSELNFRRSGNYNPDMVAALLDSLRFQSSDLSGLLLGLKSSINEPDLVESSLGYLQVLKYYNDNYMQTLDNVFSIIQNMGTSTNLNGLPSESYISVIQAYKEIEIQKSMIDIEFMAYLLAPENDTIQTALNNDIDIYNSLLFNITDYAQDFIFKNISEEYPPLLIISDYTYSDTFFLEPFAVSATISNMGAISTQPFEINISPNENSIITGLDSEIISDLTLESGESLKLEFMVKPLAEDLQSGVNINFVGERGIDESLLFHFFNQDLSYGEISNTVDHFQENIDRSFIYPNPGSKFLFISDDIKSSVKQTMIYSSNGQLMAKEKLSSNGINIEHLQPGYYTVILETEDRKIINKFIKI